MDSSDGFLGALETLFKTVLVAPINAVLFCDVAFWDNGTDGEIQLPIVVLWLVVGALFFTLRFQYCRWAVAAFTLLRKSFSSLKWRTAASGLGA